MDPTRNASLLGSQFAFETPSGELLSFKDINRTYTITEGNKTIQIERVSIEYKSLINLSMWAEPRFPRVFITLLRHVIGWTGPPQVVDCMTFLNTNNKTFEPSLEPATV